MKRSVGFTNEEAEYLSQNKLGRLATVSRDGTPHVVPVTYEFDGESLYFSGWNLKKSLKFKNIVINGKAALVVDDVGTTRGVWAPKGVEIRGNAEVNEDEKEGTYVKIVPQKKTSWGFRKNRE